ncbi:MAG: type VI secretion system-associated FHA domain protein TagH [Paracoccaceae bacterium]
MVGLTLKFQNSGAHPGGQQAVEMTGGVLTIGRGDNNDLSLPDPDRTLSKRHCVLEERGGEHVLIDISTNGTYLNYCSERLGETPTPLNHGDVISVGSYELVVEIVANSGRSELLPPAAVPTPNHIGGSSVAGLPDTDLGALDDPNGDDFLDGLLGSSTDSQPASLHPDSGVSVGPFFTNDILAPEPISPAPIEYTGASASNHSPAAQDHFPTPPDGGALIPDDWDDLMYGGGEQKAVPVPATPQPSPPQPKVAPAGQDAAQAFLEGAGASHLNIPEAELAETMTRLGRVFAAMTAGIRDVLLTRASIKSEMRVDRTMINAGGNNPLKFSISPEQAVEAMIRPSVRGYLNADAATSEALDDIKAHEVAMMSGMEAALKDLLLRLGPEHLSARIETGLSLGGLLQGKKARYWEAYEQMYAQIAQETEDNFQSTFGREFSRAYQEQLERLNK